MNAPAQPIPANAKRLLNVEEFLRICESGVFPEGEHVELWDGEIIVPPSEGAEHFNVKAAVMEVLLRNTPPGLRVGPTGPLKLGDRTILEPDLFWFVPRGKKDLPEPAQMKLVVEVAVTSLTRDRVEKALRYAAAGIEDYWVIDAARMIAWVHRRPSAEGFGEVLEYQPDQAFSPLAQPGFSIRLGDLFQD